MGRVVSDRLRTALLCLLAAHALAAAVAHAQARSDPGLRITAESDEQLVFEAEFPAATLTPQVIGERAYVRVDVAGCDHSGQPGEPDLPARQCLIAVPPGMDALVEVIEEEIAPLGPGRPLPVAEQDIILPPEGEGREAEALPGYRIDFIEEPAIYESAQAFPARLATAESIRAWRHHRLLPVTLAPVRYDPAAGVLWQASRLRVRVLFVRAPGESLKQAGGPYLEDEPSWEPLYRERILNYERARNYRRRPAQLPAIPGKRSGEGAGAAAGTLEFRVAVDSTGLYRIPFESLAAAGLELSSLEWDQLALVVRDYDDDALAFLETPVPFLPFGDQGDTLLFEAGEAIAFYGQDAWDFFSLAPQDRRYGRGNAYWLVYGAGAGPRMEERASWFGWTGLTPPATYERTMRFEQNRHLGDMEVTREAVATPRDGPLALTTDHYNWTDPTGDIHNPIRVVSFDLPTILQATGACVHLQGQSYVEDSSHRPRLWFSASAAPGETTWAFPGNPYVFLRLGDVMACDDRTIPRNVVRSGRNYLKIYLPREGDGIDNVNGDKAGIDWFEVTFTGLFQFAGGLLQAPLQGFTGQKELLLRGLPTQEVLLLDLAAPRAPVHVTTSAEQFASAPGGVWNLRLQVDCGDGSAPPEILAASSSGFVPLAQSAIELRPGEALGEFTGEDYVLIFPRRFAGEVAPLVDLREGQGHRVLAAAIEDVYDTYSGGRRHPFAVKRLLRAMWHQSSPVPDYLLLFGDASNDMGSYALDLPGLPSDTVYVPTISSLGHYFGTSGTQLVSVDAWFVDNLGGEWAAPMNMFPDLHLGRVSCGSEAEAEAYVTKVVRYETLDLTGRWRQHLVMVSDDDFTVDNSIYLRRQIDTSFATITHNSIRSVYADSVLAQVAVDSLFLNALMDSVPELGRCVRDPDHPEECLRDEHGEVVRVPYRTVISLRPNSDYGEGPVRDLLLQALNRGALAWAYQGHSHSRQIANERIFVNYSRSPSDGDDVAALANLDKPFVFHGYGCHLAEFASHKEANTYRGDAISEALLFCCPGAPRGAVAAIGSTDYESIGHVYQERVFEAMFTDPPQDEHGRRRWRLGEIADLAKVGLDVSYLERITYMLLGDPALRHGITPPWINLTLEGQPWDPGAGSEYASPREDDSLLVGIELLDEAYVGLPEVEDYYGAVPSESLRTVASGLEGRKLSLEYRTRVERRPYSLTVRTTDYEGSERQAVVTIPLGVEIYEQLGDELEPLPVGALLQDSTRLAVTVRSGAHLAAGDIHLLLGGEAVEAVEAVLDEPPGEPRTWTLRYGNLPAVAESETELVVEIVQHDGAPLPLLTRAVSVGIEVVLGIADAYWMPNPFDEQAYLVYRLTDSAARTRLRIFTSSGREILKDDTLPTTKGLRGFLWDGRDQDGDPVANGLYFFELAIWDEQGKRVDPCVLDKVVRVR